jgi:hypothetical protein
MAFPEPPWQHSDVPDKTRRWPVAAAVPLVIVALSVLAMSPALIEQHWGFYDDGDTLAWSRALQEKWFLPGSETERGRFRPAYFAYYALQYGTFGANPRGYYAVQVLVLAFTNLLTWAIVRRLVGAAAPGLLGVVVFITSFPFVESYHTLGKPEPVLLMLLLASLYCHLRALEAPARASRAPAGSGRRLAVALWVAASGASLLLAYLTKETAVISLVATSAWALILPTLARSGLAAPRPASAIGYAALNVVVFAVFIVLAYVLTPTPLPWSSGYPRLHLRLSTSADFLLYQWLRFDVLLLFALTLLGTGAWLLASSRSWDPARSLALLCTLCAGANLGLYTVVWQQQLAYYLLPTAGYTAIGISLLAWALTATPRASRVRMPGLVIMALVLLAARAHSLPSLYSAGAAISSWYRVNGLALEWIARLPKDPRRHYAVLVNYSRVHEYPAQMRVLLQMVHERWDVTFPYAHEPQDLVATAEVGDFILLNYAGTPHPFVWARGLEAPPLDYSTNWIFSSTAGLKMEEVFRVQQEHRVVSAPYFRPATFRLGWVGFQIVRRPEAALRRYADGWVAPRTDLWVAEDRLPATVRLWGRSVLPAGAAYPIRFRVTGNGDRVRTFAVERPGPFDVEIPVEARSAAEFRARRLEIVADKSFVPASSGMGPDPRELSVMVDGIALSAAAAR